ncbi:sialate O-acetylesterase [Chitinophaga sp. Cy-1792]|uniref:sialate O-acetylesterase n=1 Tax=Chitinophaga sp. Cy-1792 TaxID=2608339 RepID=UPI00141EAF2B|nr:sialate O-acetylesterase [Chitinophaga sp. Cy-1792]
MMVLLNVLSLTSSAQRSIFLAAGQSNAVGKGDSSRSVHPAAGVAVEYRWKSNTLEPLHDPVGEDDGHFQVAGTGSMWPAFAAAYHQRTRDTVIIVPAARGGASCHEKARLGDMDTWDTSGNLFTAAVAKIKAAAALSKGVLKGIIWLQGERDANAINSGGLQPAEYKTALSNLILRFRKELGDALPFYIVKTGNYKGHPVTGFDTVRKIQEDLAETMPNVFIVYRDAPLFEAKGRMTDEIHYNQNGLNHIGATVARAIKK